MSKQLMLNRVLLAPVLQPCRLSFSLSLSVSVNVCAPDPVRKQNRSHDTFSRTVGTAGCWERDCGRCPPRHKKSCMSLWMLYKSHRFHLERGSPEVTHGRRTKRGRRRTCCRSTRSLKQQQQQTIIVRKGNNNNNKPWSKKKKKGWKSRKCFQYF